MEVLTRPVREAWACVTLPALLLISLLSCPWIGSVYERCGSNSTSSPPPSGVSSSSCIRGVVLVVAGVCNPDNNRLRILLNGSGPHTYPTLKYEEPV